MQPSFYPNPPKPTVMKRITFFFTIILICSFQGILANQDSVVSFLPHWTIGEEKQLTITSTQLILKDDSPKQKAIVYTTQSFTVLEKNNDGYLLNWKATGRFINPFATTPNLSELLDSINKTYEPLSIIFHINFKGQPVELSNFDDIQEFYITTLSEFEAVLLQKGFSVENVKTLIKPQMEIITNKTQMQKVIFKSIQTLFSIYNRSFKTKPNKKKYTRQLPLFPREVALIVNTTTQNPDSTTFIIRAESKIIEEDIENTLLSFELNEYFHQLETLPPDKKNDRNYGEISQYTINPVSGWLKEAKFHTALLIDGTYIEHLLVFSLK